MQLQKIMGQLGIVQQTGHGVTTITARYGKEVFEIGENHITVKIPFAFKPHRTPVQNPGSLTSSQQAVLNELQNNPELTASQIAQNINLSTARVYQIEKELTQKGIIQRSGSRKSGTWTILPKK